MMSALSTATPQEDYRHLFQPKQGPVVVETKIRLDSQKPVTHAKPKRVTEAEYWNDYYDDAEVIYEWNNGLLEEKTVSDHENYLMHLWFVELMRHFLSVRPIAKTTGLEIGFRLNLPHKTTIRRPDLGVVLNSNPIPLLRNDRTYQGVCDMCIEALSDSTPEEIKRDTDTKLSEYEMVGVKEYYILYTKGEPMAFYRLNQHGVYVPIKPVKGNVIQSVMLPGFQFRISDLSSQPSLKRMAFDPVYKDFILPYYQAEKKRADTEKNRADKELRLRQREAQRADKEAQRADATEERNKHLEAELARLKKR